MRYLVTLLFAATVLWMSSCTVHRTAGKSGKVPPGQAKKITGKKSARDHAPGQRKKNFQRKKDLLYNDIINER
ncbi:quinol oxidase subunit 4 [Parapedobacter deserti]|uniref:Quinol oxidase subunit 4 n=1 Tax=Parapedobacter deserti TaxID=1912957 RepID=A0ABV7JLN2_9SPHI